MRNQLILSATVVALCGCSENQLTETEYRQLIAQSDHVEEYESQFVQGTRYLIEKDICTVADFKQMGGWWKAQFTRKRKPIYFTYCGDHGHVRGRIYLNVHTLQYSGHDFEGIAIEGSS